MAKASDKRIASQNAASLQILKFGFLLSQGLYAVCLLLFPSLKTWYRLLLHGLSTCAAGAVALQLYWRGRPMTSNGVMVRAGDDLSQAGLTSYMFDFIYITWTIHVLAALITFKAYWLYLSVPGYVFYKAWSYFIYPRFFAKSSTSSVAATPAPDQAGPSKRQQKFKERYGDSDAATRVKYSRK